jgi:outer membrane protein assembly factor BamB
MRRQRQILVGQWLIALLPAAAFAADWPQWRGPDRDGRTSGFAVPADWPKELTKKWSVSVGEGVATPALVAGRLYVFTREGGGEVLRCLDAATGQEQWKDSYEEPPVTGPAGQFPGPRSSPTVADGKILTLGVSGTVSCVEAASGKVLWRKSKFADRPRFFTSCSPLVAAGLVIVQVGNESGGGIVALELTSGQPRWEWKGDGTAYSSPVLMTLGGTPLVIAETAAKIVALDLASGQQLWETPFPVSGRGYNAATPIVSGQTLLYAGSSRGLRAVRLEKQGDGVVAKELWSNSDGSVMYNTPVVKGEWIFGISEQDMLFCVHLADGKTLWKTSFPGRGRLRGYGSVVDAGPVLVALNPSAQLTFFAPSDQAFTPLASYKVSDNETFAYPILAGSHIYIKDRDSVILWTLP